MDWLGVALGWPNCIILLCLHVVGCDINSTARMGPMVFSKLKRMIKIKPQPPQIVEKVYSVSGIPTQHICGISKTNKKLSPSLKRHINVLSYLN